MPAGMEWPRFEDGELVHVGDSAPFGTDDVMEVTGVEINRFGYVLHGSVDNGARECVDGDEHGVAVKRPAPKVLDADGVEIRVGDTVYLLPGDWCNKFPLRRCREWDAMKVINLSPNHDTGRIGCGTSSGFVVCYPYPSQLTHRAPVLAADGKPLEVGQTVWDEDGTEYTVCEVGPQSVTVEYWNEGIAAHGSIAPSQLTHAKPEPPDSWERIEEDAGCTATKYNERRGTIFTTKQQVARDLVRRAKALAERGE